MPPTELFSYNPCTNDVVWRGAQTELAALDGIAARARAAFADWARRPLGERIAVAETFARLAAERKPGLASLISNETGKPFWEAKTEVDSIAAKIKITIAAQAERAGTRLSETGTVTNALRHKPHGVLAVLGPFNFPMHLPNGHLAPALLAGNAVVFKPSEKTPASGMALAGLWHEAGVPGAVLQTVVGGPDLGRALVGHDGVDGVLFTGSAAAGLAIHRSMAGKPHKLLALELGGDNPILVWDTDDIDSAAHIVAQSAFVSAGQRCSCARRLIVADGKAGDRIVEALTAVTDRLRVGAPFDDPEPFLGPVIDVEAAARLVARFESLAQLGTVLRPLRPLTDGRPYLSPALLAMDATAPATSEELFGPVLQIRRAGTFDQAIVMANDTGFGLAAGLISDRRDLFDIFWGRSRAGIVNWNRPTVGASSAAPFGGVGLSGNHRPSAYYAADYSAYPVAGLETPDTDFRITQGLS